MHVTCRAHPVQGLVCAHGYKSKPLKTLPAEAVFVSIRALRTRVRFQLLDSHSQSGIVRSNGRQVSPEWHKGITSFVDKTLKRFGHTGSYAIDVKQNFQSGIGVGGSAAIYAALARCIVNIVGAELTEREMSTLARLGSYSAAAAITGNVSVIRCHDSESKNAAEVLCPAEEFPFRLVVLPVVGHKLSSDIHADMPLSRFYRPWLEEVRRVSKDVVSSIKRGAWDDIGRIVEPHIFSNLAAMCTGDQNLMPWQPGTLQRLALLRKLRLEKGLRFFISMNSGPAVFAYVAPEDLRRFIASLRSQRISCIASEIGGACIVEQPRGIRR